METKESLMVGYLQSWGDPAITFTTAAEKGYTAIVMAFGTIDGTTVGIADGSFVPSPTPEQLKEDIAQAKLKGAKQILFSVGGQNNTYNPGSAPVEELATALVNYMADFGFTGIDFDLEIDGDANYLDSLCQEINKLNADLVLTAAPQVNQADHASELFLVSHGNANIFSVAVENNRFDYLFIQAYNNPWPEINGCKQTDVCFVSEGFKSLKKSIPPQTMIVMGLPANKDAAGTSVFTAPNVPENIYQLIAEQYELINEDAVYGGAMVWSVNQDSKTGYQFVDNVKQATLSHSLKDH